MMILRPEAPRQSSAGAPRQSWARLRQRWPWAVLGLSALALASGLVLPAFTVDVAVLGESPGSVLAMIANLAADGPVAAALLLALTVGVLPVLRLGLAAILLGGATRAGAPLWALHQLTGRWAMVDVFLVAGAVAMLLLDDQGLGVVSVELGAGFWLLLAHGVVLWPLSRHLSRMAPPDPTPTPPAPRPHDRPG